MGKTGWGIIGPGSIAKRFMNDLPYCKGVNLAAVASRNIEKAKDFAEQHGFKNFYGCYEDLAHDDNVDVVYIAVPHPFHKEYAIMCMNAGKSVLCEKPVAINKQETVDMVECARKNNVFLMEAMWTRHFPVNRQVKKLLDSGELGKVTLIKADFGFGSWTNGIVQNPDARLFNMELAGGALLDVGVYTVSYASWMKGQQPTAVKALLSKLNTGVDGMNACLLQYGDGAMAILESSIVQTTRQDAVIYCEHGYITINDFWHPTEAIVKYNEDREDKIIDDTYNTYGRTGFGYEAQHVIDCIREGLTESPYMTWQDSIDVMDTLDAIRRETGLIYPFENK